MQSVLRSLETYKSYIIFGCMFGFLLIGLIIVPDMPANWDELANRRYGWNALGQAQNFLSTFKPIYARSRGGEHGTGYELLLYLVEYKSGLDPKTQEHAIYLMRHYLIFLTFFSAAACFFLLCRRYFRHDWLALFGFFLFISHPRIFNHAFHNSSDIGFLSFCTITAYFVFRMIEDRDLRSILGAAIFSGLAVATRPPGIMFIGLALLALGVAWLRDRKRFSLRRLLFVAGMYSALSWCFLVLFWPFLWGNAVSNFVWALSGMSNLDFSTPMVYLGNPILSNNVPRGYNFVWIIVTTPVATLCLIALGHIALVWAMLRQAKRTVFDEKVWFVFSWLWVSLLAPAVLHSTLFDEWRHHFFVYPAMAFFCVYGLKFICDASSMGVRWANHVACVLAVASIGISLFRVVSLHPYQNLYFSKGYDWVPEHTNGRDVKFEIDYWGMTYREGLEYLASNNQGMIKVKSNRPIEMNRLILPTEVGERIQLTGDADCDFRMSTYRNTSKEFTDEAMGPEVYAKFYRGAKVLTVRRCVRASP